jgi:hypothetical protein
MTSNLRDKQRPLKSTFAHETCFDILFSNDIVRSQSMLYTINLLPINFLFPVFLKSLSVFLFIYCILHERMQWTIADMRIFPETGD